MWFFWWDDARDYAVMIAGATQVRHKVHAHPVIGWRVELADDAVLVEACS